MSRAGREVVRRVGGECVLLLRPAPSSPNLRPLCGSRCSWRGRMADGLLEAVRGLRLADPELGPKPLLAKLRAQQPDLGAGTREVREALTALKAESEAREAAAAPRRPLLPRRPPPPRRPLQASAVRLCPRRWRRASLASAAPGCRQRWATAG